MPESQATAPASGAPGCSPPTAPGPIVVVTSSRRSSQAHASLTHLCSTGPQPRRPPPAHRAHDGLEQVSA